MVFLLCEGCGNVVEDNIFGSHIIKNNEAPTGSKPKESCPIWLDKNGG